MPSHADHQATVVTPVSRPPVLAVGHQRFDIRFDRFKVERFYCCAVIVVRVHRIRTCTVLMQNVDV